MNTVYLQTYFVTIAYILGTGILGLPVTLGSSGFYPFLVEFIISFIIQVLVIFIFVEILQKAHAIQIKYDKEKQEAPKNLKNLRKNSSDKMSKIKSGTKWEMQSFNSETELLMDEDTCDELEDHPDNEGPVLADHDIPAEQKSIRSPDLHLLGEMFLCNGIRHVFDIFSIFDMVILLIAYSLAGSDSYSEMLGIKYINVIPVFIWSLAFFIIFAFKLIQPVISILTFIKASLFTMAVILPFFGILDAQENVQNNFNYIQDSFLISTLALAGSFFVMPLLFRKIENVASQIQKYRFAVLMGLVTSAILNILWCWTVIQIVPQHCTPMIGTNQSSHSPVTCNSLESAKENGEISTKPLIRILRHKYPSFSWVSKVVEVFILISITASSLTVGTAMHHMICGIIESKLTNCLLSKYTVKFPMNMDIGKICASNFLSLILFGIIFIIAMLNPKGFLDMIEKFTSLISNTLNFIVFMMFMATKGKENSKLKIPLPLPKMVMPFIFFLPLYFGFAIGYDIYFSVMSYLHHEADKSHLPELQHLHHNSPLLNVSSPLRVNATS